MLTVLIVMLFIGAARSFQSKGPRFARAFYRARLVMMPEGPEVRSLVDSLQYEFVQTHTHEIRNASIMSGRYLRKEPDNFGLLQGSAGPGSVLRDVRCKGKFIYFLFDDFAIWSTLGMTGGWTTYPHRKHIRFSLTFKNLDQNRLATLYYYDQRNFGTLKVSTEHADLEAKLKSLGYDWLSDDTRPSKEDWLALGQAAAKRSRPLCVFMMDQKKSAGIGNYVLSEALYRARIHPFACTSALDEEGWAALHMAVQSVLNESYAAQRPIIDEGTGKAQRRHQGKRYKNSDFYFRIYSRSVTSEGFEVTKMLGTHKRSVFFAPEVQKLFKPEGWSAPGEL